MGQAPTSFECRRLTQLPLLLLIPLLLLLPNAIASKTFLSINVLRILISASPHAPPRFDDLKFLFDSEQPDAASFESDLPPFDPVSCACGSAGAPDDPHS
jgi:hypothetical protein